MGNMTNTELYAPVTQGQAVQPVPTPYTRKKLVEPHEGTQILLPGDFTKIDPKVLAVCAGRYADSWSRVPFPGYTRVANAVVHRIRRKEDGFWFAIRVNPEAGFGSTSNRQEMRRLKRFAAGYSSIVLDGIYQKYHNLQFRLQTLRNTRKSLNFRCFHLVSKYRGYLSDAANAHSCLCAAEHSCSFEGLADLFEQKAQALDKMENLLPEIISIRAKLADIDMQLTPLQKHYFILCTCLQARFDVSEIFFSEKTREIVFKLDCHFYP